jgi:archaellum component FlaG (FlaF/FlaG flagellin family)
MIAVEQPQARARARKEGDRKGLRPPSRDRKGVSEVVGALLIIVILISAVATLSFFLTTSQAQAQTRATYLATVQNDDLQITNAQFSPIPGGGGWGTVALTVRNLNTGSAGLDAISVNGSWMLGWEEVNPSVALGPKNDAPPLMIPPKSSVTVKLDFTNSTSFPYHYFPSATKPLAVVMESDVGDFFPTLYNPPVAIGTTSTQSANHGGITRDTIVFDGAQSQATGGSIQKYSWKIEVPTRVSESCSSVPAVVTVEGKSFVYPSEMFSPPIGSTTFSLLNCIDGPIQATLTVTDQNGFNSTSQTLTVPADGNIDPPASISAAKASSPCSLSPCTVTVTVKDGFGNPMPGQVVNAVAVNGDVSANSPSQTTGIGGQATFVVSYATGGSMDFETGQLLPAQVSFP